jgi:hypothetical protein
MPSPNKGRLAFCEEVLPELVRFFKLVYRVAAVGEVVAAFLFSESVEQFSDGVFELGDGPCGCGSQ